LKVSEREVVAALGQHLCQRLGEPRYRLWFQDKTHFCWDGDHLVVGVPNRFFQEWLQKTFAQDVQEVASALLGQPLQVSFTIDPQLFQDFRQREAANPTYIAPIAEPTSLVVPDAPAKSRPVPREDHKSRSRRWRKLEDFIVGSCNRVAHASALSVVEAPGQGPNPLVVHGPVGTGKTHLLEGVYLGLRRQEADSRIVLGTAEEFTNRFVQAMRLGKLGSFRKQFREAEALFLDDIHFLAKKLATQEEFLHTLDALLLNERPVVLTCDCHPRLVGQFMPELTDRLLGGAIWSLNLPEKDTRISLLRTKALKTGGQILPEEVVEFLADKLRGNVRELEGAVHTLLHFARVTGRAVSVELAREALAEVLRNSIRVVQLEDVERAVCSILSLEEGSLRGKQRGWMYSHPRMLAIYLARKHTGASYTEIGKHLGGRNHSTAVAAEKKVRQWLKEDQPLRLGQRTMRARDVVEKIERELAR
jgi:chromosomal replication initiator protein